MAPSVLGITHTGSAVAAGGNLTMTAASDMTVAGSQVVAGGNAVLAAGKSLSVVSVQDTFSSFVKTKSGNGGLFSSSSKKTVTQDYRTNKASTAGAGGNLTLAAGVMPPLVKVKSPCVITPVSPWMV